MLQSLILASIKALMYQDFFSERNDSSLFVFGSHSKKRPHNLVFGKFCECVRGGESTFFYWHVGRLFDFHVLDMIEVGILKLSSSKDFKAEGCVLGSKPCMLFCGDIFETDSIYIRLKNLFIGKSGLSWLCFIYSSCTDLFRGVEVSKVRLGGLDHVISFTAHDGKICMRVYRYFHLHSPVVIVATSLYSPSSRSLAIVATSLYIPPCAVTCTVGVHLLS